jgi:hypothetical protein
MDRGGTKRAAIKAIDVTNDHIDLGSGKVYRINGTQVVGAGIGTYTGFTGTIGKKASQPVNSNQIKHDKSLASRLFK